MGSILGVGLLVAGLPSGRRRTRLARRLALVRGLRRCLGRVGTLLANLLLVGVCGGTSLGRSPWGLALAILAGSLDRRTVVELQLDQLAGDAGVGQRLEDRI